MSEKDVRHFCGQEPVMLMIASVGDDFLIKNKDACFVTKDMYYIQVMMD